MPEGEVKELTQEANDKGKNRSSHIRSILRARHIEEQLEEQVLTKEDKREYEETIERLKRERNEFKREMNVAKSRVEAIEETVDETVREAVGPIRGEYESQIRELKEENKRLRKDENEELREQNKELFETLEKVVELIPSEERVESLEAGLEEFLEKADRQWQGTTEQRELIMNARDELRRDVRRNRTLSTRVIDRVHQLFGWTDESNKSAFRD